MCGIAGVLRTDGATPKIKAAARAMGDTLAHRGPDDHGVWSDADAGIALAHRRLAILDLSPTGHQPMLSADGRLVVTFNGENFNFQELRAELAARGVTFRGTSDTEVMLEAFALFGIAPTVKRLIGMFTIGIWDRRERTLTLVRDRLGIKPLYWAKFGALFLFGSEPRALRAFPGWQARIDRAALAGFMRHNYVPASRSIYEGVRRLEPGTILTLPWGGEPTIERFWDARAVAQAGLADPLRADDHELTDRLEELLRDAVKDAAAVARHLGTAHTEMMVTAKDALDVIPRLPDIYDEPFADPSQIPTYLVSALTRQHVTVALSGDGGDELFAGYNRYRLATRLWRSLRLLPQPLRAALARAITAVPAGRWSELLSVMPERARPRQSGDKLHKLAATLSGDGESALYRRLVTQWEPAEVMPGVEEAKGVLWDASIERDFPNALERMQFLDLATYLPDDILTKV